jgi:hypothetical protein
MDNFPNRHRRFLWNLEPCGDSQRTRPPPRHRGSLDVPCDSVVYCLQQNIPSPFNVNDPSSQQPQRRRRTDPVLNMNSWKLMTLPSTANLDFVQDEPADDPQDAAPAPPYRSASAQQPGPTQNTTALPHRPVSTTNNNNNNNRGGGDGGVCGKPPWKPLEFA